MDWQERLRRNRQTIAQESQDRFASISSALDRRPVSMGGRLQDEDDEEPGFLGAITGLGKGVYDIGKGAVDLVGNAIGDVMQSAGDAVGGISDVISGQVATNENEASQKEYREKQKKITDKINSIVGDSEDPALWDRPDVQGLVNEQRRLTLESGESLPDDVAAGVQFDKAKRDAALAKKKGIDERLEKSQDVDATKTAAAAADTFLNVATAGGAGTVKNIGVSAGKQVARKLGREVAENTMKKAAVSGGRRLAQDVTEGVLVGGVQGGLSQVREKGADASAADIATSALTGSALSGALSGGMSIALNKNVRQALPGLAERGRDFVTDRATYATKALTGDPSIPRAVREGGYIRLPGGADPADMPGGIPPGVDPMQYIDDLFGTTKAAADDVVDAAPTKIELGSMDAVRRAKIQQSLESGDIDLKKFTPEERKLINSELDNVIAQNDDRLAAEMMGVDDLESLMANRAGGEFTMPMMTKQEIAQYYGKADKAAWPLKYTRKADGGLGVDRQAQENGFDDVEEYLDRARAIMDAKSGKKTTTAALSAARKDPAYIQQAVRNVVSDTPVEAPVATAVPDRPGAGYDSPADVQRSLGRMESETNPWVDYVTAPRDTVPGRQADLELPAGSPYEGFAQNLERPALGSGEPTGPVALSPSAAKRAAAAGSLPENYVISPKTSRKAAIELPADATTLGDTATRTTKSGQVKPLMNGPEGVPQDTLDAVRELKQLNDETGVFKKIAPTKDLNTINEDITREIGGIQSKPGQMIEGIRAKIQAAGGETVRYNNAIRDEAEDAFKRYNFTPEQWDAVNKWLNQQGPDAARIRQDAFDDISKQFGPDVQARAKAMFDEWSPKMRAAMEDYNAEMTRLGQTDKIIGDLGENYWPRVYAQKSLKDKATDITHAIIDLKQTGLDKTGFNPNTFSGSTTQASGVLGGEARNFNQAPIGSEFTDPTAAFTGFRKSRTAKSPIQPQVNPLEAAVKYLESVNTAKTNSSAVFDIRGVQKAIKTVQEETGDNGVTILHDVLNNSANALLGKTNEFDRAFSRYAVTQKALEYGGLIAKQLSRSQLLGSLKTVFAQTGQAPLIAAEVGPQNALWGVRQTFSKDMDKLFAQSDFLASNKMYGNKSPFSASQMARMVNKTERVAGWGMDAAASASARATWAGAWRKATEDLGLTGKAAIQEADRITGKIVGNRTAGLRPSLYESRALQPIAMYTLDINQMYQATKGYIGTKNYKALGTLVAGAFAYNLLYEQLTGDKLLADPVDAALDAGNILVGDNILDDNGDPIGFLERVTRAGGRLAGEAATATPLGNVAAGSIYPENGFKIPFSQDRLLTRAELFGDSQLGRFGGSAPITSAFDNPLNLLGIPGSNQLQRSFTGVQAYNEGESSTPSGRQRFSIEQDPENFIRALLYGQYQTREGREYLLNRNRNLRGEEQ